jgi:hypothetical protein
MNKRLPQFESKYKQKQLTKKVFCIFSFIS